MTEYEGGVVSLLPPHQNPTIDWRYDWEHPGVMKSNSIIIGNPPVDLLEPDMFITQPLDGIAMVPMPIPVRDSYSLRNITESCELPPNPTVFIFHGGRYYRHEPRAQLVDNTIDNPYIERRITYQTDSRVTGGMRRSRLAPSFCPASGPNFMNRGGCVRQNSCSQPVFSEGTVVLNAELIRQLFTKSQKYVYSLTDLSLDGFSDDEISPCSAQTRWKKTTGRGSCDADTPLDAATLASLSAHMANQNEVVLQTPDIIIIQPVQGECTTELNNVSIVGAKVTLNGTCYEQVHPDSHNVYDMAYWRQAPALRRDLGGAIKLTRPATQGETELVLSSVCADRNCWPPRWHNELSSSNKLCHLLGVLGEEVDFSSLPSTVQVPWLAEFAGVADVYVDPLVSTSCGSLGEVANDPVFGHKYGDRRDLSLQKPTFAEESMVWPNAVFHAKDHVRQRVAWALSQIYVVSGPGGYQGSISSMAQYYDILVRNALGNFRNLIKEVAYSEPMSVMLTYRYSQSAAVSGQFADENFAR